MKKFFLNAGAIAFSAALLAGCASTTPPPPEEAPEPETVASPPCACPEASAPETVIGEVEYASVGDEGLLQKARIDTGATTTSVGYRELQRFERDGEGWVRFSVEERLAGTVYNFERPLVRVASIKRHGAEAVERPVVKLRVTIGSIQRDIEVTLADRDSFEYPVLIGRNFLDGAAVVDVSQRFLAGGGSEE